MVDEQETDGVGSGRRVNARLRRWCGLVARWAFVLGAGVWIGCSPFGPSRLTRVPSGLWGGDHISLSVHDGGASLEFDCAHGTIEQAMLLDAGGRFDVGGTFVREHGGPVRDGEPTDSHPARYAGSTDGRTLALTVVLMDDNRTIGAFTLVLGQPPRLLKCL